MSTIEQIAASLQGYDPQALPAASVKEFLARLAEPVADVEAVGVFDALGRVLAQDLVSPISVPPRQCAALASACSGPSGWRSPKLARSAQSTTKPRRARSGP